MNKIVECVPNFSEGRDLDKVEQIVSAFRGVRGVNLLSYEPDADYNRVVVTVMGEPEAVKEAVINSVKIATELIDLRNHTGEHSRMGASDVVPFIPIKNMTIEECVEIAKEVGERIADELAIPVFLYESAATCPERVNLAKIRKGQFEKMAEKLQEPNWKPDFGESQPHPSAGVTAVGARNPLFAFNIDLDTADIEIANKIAKAIRHSSGGFRYIKAGGVYLKERNHVQVTMNITDYTKTAVYRVFETVKMEAKRYGVNVIGSEIIGLVPMASLIDTAEYYLKVRDFTMDKVIETRLMESLGE